MLAMLCPAAVFCEIDDDDDDDDDGSMALLP
jgi:hypothetical protein